MIEILFAKLQQLTNRLIKIRRHTQTTVFGDGTMGNIYIGSTDDDIPDEIRLKYDTRFCTSSGVVQLPATGSLDFDNLYIAEGAKLTFPGEVARIRVRGTLTLNGVISIANVQSGNCMKSNDCPQIRSVVTMYGHAKLLTENGFFLTGGPGATSIFPDSPSGGCLVCYYCNLLDYNGKNRGDNWDADTLKLNGGTNGNSGGCLILAANTIRLGPSGYLDVTGGNGNDTNPKKRGIFINTRLKSVDFE